MPYVADPDLIEIAAELTLSEEQFAALYDPLAETRPSQVPLFKLLKVIGGTGESLYAKALTVARQNGFLSELAEGLVLAGGFEKPDIEVGVTTQLQAIINPDDGIWDVGLLSSNGLRAVRLVCRITVRSPSGDASGTGFLVGPQAVITSWHVIRGLLDDQGRPRDNTSRSIEIEFGRIRNAAAPVHCKVADGDWLVAGSPPHSSEDPGNVPATPVDQEDALGFDAALDYAVIALAQPIGNRLGYYRLDPARMPDVNGISRLFVLQHPGGGTMRWTTGYGTKLWPPEVLSRLSHTANTSVGSSGGLLLDHSFEPVGLHQCAVRAKDGKIVNGAIPTARIVAHGGDFCRTSGFVPLTRLGDGTSVIGREKFQRMVREAQQQSIGIISVGGGRRTGRSFSERLLHEMLPAQENLLLSLKASDIPVEPDALARKLLERVGAVDVELPDPEKGETGKDGWIRDKLFPALAAQLRAASRGSIIWLVLDDLDVAPLANSTSRHLLEMIYLSIGELPFLRVVLLGLDGRVPAANPRSVGYDLPAPFTEEEITICLETFAVGKGLAISSDELRRHAKAVVEMAAISTDDPVPAAADHVDVLVRRVLT